jgi:transposase
LLAQGAEAFGFLGAVWTRRRVAQLINDEFGVRYHPGHVSRLLKQIEWTPNDLSSAPASGMKPRLRRGPSNAGPRLRKVPARRAHDRVR